MSEQASSNRVMLPYVAGAVVLLIILAFVLFMPSEEGEKPVQPEARDIAPVAVAPPVAIEPDPEPLEEEPAVVEAESPPPVIDEPEVEIIPEPPLDISDAAVKAAVLAVSEYPVLGRLLVNDDLINRFVVLTVNIANGDIAQQHRLFNAPEQNFKTFQQGGKTWIDANSFKRYSAYVESVEGLSNEAILSLLETYQPAIEESYEEIGQGDQRFNDALIQAIDHVLATPSYPLPVEVFTDSVMYKFKNEKLESLSPVQKQVLRMGPDNMRRLKNKLRSVLDTLDES